MLTTGWCTPAPIDLIIGVTSGAGRVLLKSTAGSNRPSQVQLPASLHSSAAAFYGFIRGGSISVASQPASGGAVRTVSVRTREASNGCGGRYVGLAR